MANYLYDIEVSPNMTLIVFKNVVTEQVRKFKQTKNKSNFDKFEDFITQPDLTLVGFNNNHYDDRIIKYILDNNCKFTTQDIYNLSQCIIENKVAPGFKAKWNEFNSIPFAKSFQSIDLYGVYRNKGLKYLALGLGITRIQELPYDPHKELTDEEIEQVEIYCENDVVITEALYKESLNKIEARQTLNEKYTEVKRKLGYKKDFVGLSDSTLAADTLALNYCDKNNISLKEFQKLRRPDYDTITVKDLIFDDIKFKTQVCNELLNKLKSAEIHLKPDYINDYKNKDTFETLVPVSNDEVKEEVVINGKTYQIGLGGIHSTVRKQVYEGEIIDVDVSSYYPTLIINNKIKPDFLNDTWIEIYDDITKQRLQAKKRGDKRTADALKIIINSAYGNYRYPYFYAYDPKTAYTVTLNGQLYLLMLIESLELAGHEVISANTDGITYIKNPESDESDILTEWQKNTGFELEKTLYIKYTEKDVNNYSALKSNGEIKRKGMFAPPEAGKGLSANIITNAVENYIYKGIPVEDTINKCKDISLFLYSHETGKQFKTEFAGQEIQRINRYFISTVNQAHYLQKRDKNNKLTSIVANKKVVLANDLGDKELIKLVDKKHYINEANKILDDLLAINRAKELLKVNTKAIETLQNQSLKLFPKKYKENPKGIKFKDLPDSFDFSAYPTVAVITGEDVIAIDVDYPELLPHKLKEELQNSNTLKSYVHEGGRCKYFFKVKSSDIKQRSYLKSYGYEILYGKPANIAGAYNYNDEYKFEGVIADIPENLLETLKRIQATEKPPTKVDRTIPDLNQDEIDIMLDFVRDTLTNRGIEFREEIPEYDYKRQICHEYAQIIFHFSCPFYDEHTSHSNSDVILCINEYGRIFVRCWHESCRDSIIAFTKELNEELKEHLKQVHKDDSAAEILQNDEETEFIKNIKPLVIRDIQLDKFYKTLVETKEKSLTLINAPTGCGKTYTSIKYAIECVKLGETVAIICSTIEEVKRTAGIIKGYNFDDFSLAISGFDTEPKKFKSIVVTTYAYITSKGDSGTPYKIAKKILSGRVVICDEIQMIATYSDKIIPLCGRYQIEDNILKLTTQCPHTSRKGTCENCNRIFENKIELKTQEFLLYKSLPYIEKYRQQIQKPIEDKIFNPEFYNDISINSLKVQYIEPDKKLFNLFPFIAENISNFDDLQLRIQFPFVEGENGKEYLTKEDVIKLSESEKPPKIHFPKYACGVPMLHCKSKMFYENIFTHAKGVIAMSATIPLSIQNDFENFAANAGFEMQKCNIEANAIKFNVAALKLDRKLSHSDINYILNNVDLSTFLVEPTLYDAKIQYDELTKDNKLASKIIFFRQGDYTNIFENIQGEAKVENCTNTIRLTYANSAICRAKDMPDIDFVIVDCSQFLPTLALDFKSKAVDKLEMRDIQARNIEDKLHQIIGRVFRSKLDYNPNITQVDNRKIILLLHNLPYELQDFKPSHKICNTYEEYRNEQVTGYLDKKRKECIVTTIKEILIGKRPDDKGLEQKCDMMFKALKVGLSKLNRRTEYDLLSDEDRAYIKQLKRDKNPYKEIMSYFIDRYNYYPNKEVKEDE